MDFNEQIAEFEPGLEDPIKVVLLCPVPGPHCQQIHGYLQAAVEEPHRGDDVREPGRMRSVPVEVDQAPEADLGVETEERLLHDLQTQGVVPDPDTLLVVAQVSLHCPSVDVP